MKILLSKAGRWARKRSRMSENGLNADKKKSDYNFRGVSNFKLENEIYLEHLLRKVKLPYIAFAFVFSILVSLVQILLLSNIGRIYYIKFLHPTGDIGLLWCVSLFLALRYSVWVIDSHLS